ncbi:MAG: DUF308 domain-containing protein [Bacteroidales bacterium]|nr:DUF308 domain-containing protein [Bacteroidales bacterium]
MKRHFENLIDRAARAIRHWWLLMLAGVLSVALGIAVFVFPLESYVTLSILFGILILISGAAQLIIAATSGNYLMMRGYIIVGGIIDLLLGIFLCIYPAVSLFTLPIMMGICLLYHSFMIISFGGDIETFRLHGGAWIICGGVLLLILSILVLVNPLSVGIDTVIVIAGLGLLMLGVMMCAIALKLKDLHTRIEREYPRQ